MSAENPTPTETPTPCPVCHYYKAIPPELGPSCKCNGVQPWALSQYPGEFKLVESHPGNDPETHFYKRSDIDPIIAQLTALTAQLEEAGKLLSEAQVVLRDAQANGLGQGTLIERIAAMQQKDSK